MANILLPTIGTRGDVQPYIALALGLQAAGHAARVATHPTMRALVERYGVGFAPIGPDIDIGREAAAIRANAPHWMLGLMRVMRFSFDMLARSHDDLLALCQEADLVIVPHSAAGCAEAEQVGRPTVSVTLMPQAIPAPDPTEPWVKRALGKLAGAGMSLVMTRPLNRMRKRWGLPKMGPEGITSRTLNLIPLSPRVFPPNPRWEARHVMTGYWFAPSPEAWSPPEDLLAFLEAGDPPVVVSLGAMALSGDDAPEAARVALAAMERAGARAVIQGWDAAMQTLDLPPTVYRAGPLPHDWLLPQASAIVHHGGFGTTAAGLRAGIPAVVIPHIIDQFIWGQRIFELGVGPEPLPRPKLTAESLAQALIQVTRDGATHAKAARLGEQIRAEHGVATAVQLIEERMER